MRLRLPWRGPPAPDPAAEVPDRDDPERDERAEEAVESGEAELSVPTAVPPVVVPRWIQLVLLPLALLGLWALVRAAGPIVLILIVASVIALILNPLVKVLERRRLPRG